MAQKQLHKKVLPGNHPVGNKKSAPVKKYPFSKIGTEGIQ